MSGVYSVFLKLAEKMNGAEITGQFAKDIVWLIAALFGFWLLVLIALTPYYLLRWIFNRK
jgi:hypothetical protein